MGIFFTSDHHFGHSKVIEYSKRPYTSVEQMDADLIRKWNEAVSEDDLVYYLGDFTLNKKHLHNVSKLNGIKYLIPGNHDSVFPSHKKWMKEEQRYRDAGFRYIFPTPQEASVGGVSVLMWHLPYLNLSATAAEGYEPKYKEWRLEDKGQVLVHGHVHERWKKKDRMINVGVDAWNGYPVSEKELYEAIIDERDSIGAGVRGSL